MLNFSGLHWMGGANCPKIPRTFRMSRRSPPFRAWYFFMTDTAPWHYDRRQYLSDLWWFMMWSVSETAPISVLVVCLPMSPESLQVVWTKRAKPLEQVSEYVVSRTINSKIERFKKRQCDILFDYIHSFTRRDEAEGRHWPLSLVHHCTSH